MTNSGSNGAWTIKARVKSDEVTCYMNSGDRLGLHLAVATAMAAIGGAATPGCTMCGDVTQGVVPSPDGRFVAEIIERNCGATADYARRVVLDRNGLAGLLTKSETVFVVEGQVAVVVTSMPDSRRLKIHHEGGEVFRRLAEWRELSVDYSDRQRSETLQAIPPEASSLEVGPPPAPQ